MDADLGGYLLACMTLPTQKLDRSALGWRGLTWQ
jgi:hypothetical protein